MEHPVITPSRIRAFLLDRQATDNFLLDEVEMDSTSIDNAMFLTVLRYNEAMPDLGECYTVETFPYAYAFLMGTTGHLLTSKSLNLTRNAMPVTSTSGVALDDKEGKGKMYVALGEKYLKEFDDRIRQIKQDKNIRDGFGWCGGP